MSHQSPGKRRLRIVIVTNGSWFATRALEQLLGRIAGGHDVRLIVATGLRRQRGNRAVEALRLLRTWGVGYFAYKATVNVLPVTIGRLTGRGYSIETVCRRLGVAVDHTRNVNAPAAAEQIRAFAPDLLISFSCPSPIGAAVLAIPRIGSLNVHSSLLPRYAGMAGYVHSLANGDSYTGVTVHEMVERLDAGRLVGQRRIEIQRGMSVFRLFLDQCLTGAELLAEAVDAAATTGRIDGEAQDLSQRTYVGEPTRADLRRLHRNGFRLISAGELRELLRGGSTAAAAAARGGSAS